MMSDGVLSGSWYNRLRHRNHVEKLTCFKCGKEIKPGDKVHTNSANRTYFLGSYYAKKIKVYHAECFDQLFIEC